MRFFTREWLSGELDETYWERVVPAYEAHLDRIMPLLPGPVQTLARGVNIHDSLIRSVDLRVRRRTLKLALRCGDKQVGYYHLDLVYRGVDWDASNLRELASIARTVRAEAVTTKSMWKRQMASAARSIGSSSGRRVKSRSCSARWP